MLAERTDTSFQTSRTSSRNPSVYENTADVLPWRPRTESRIPAVPQPEFSPSPVEQVRRPMAQRGPLPVRLLRALGWRSPMALAVLVASFGVTIAAIYISAYARVSAEGLEETKLQIQIAQAAEQHTVLAAHVSQLSLASHAEKTASDMSMVPNDATSEQLLLQNESDGSSIAATLTGATASSTNAVVMVR